MLRSLSEKLRCLLDFDVFVLNVHLSLALESQNVLVCVYVDWVKGVSSERGWDGRAGRLTNDPGDSYIKVVDSTS